ncbi:HBR508Wp [Eremothecium sinecaudum]|uniref:HBR508Wp n=1 Tax=Eremothecium sinecaudum TaxID=45286 RepID=A0A120K1I1_9SACH|nr:HBR508Wp [Eremothecium sinecaudum]AMD19409.1 HBR508Wp [Eremothecium sinecaudum]
MTSKSETKVESQDEAIAKVLKDPTKKRKAEDEIEIDLSQPVPLSKKQKRLLRRGKVTLEELNAKYNIDPKSIEDYNNEDKKESQDPKDAQGSESKKGGEKDTETTGDGDTKKARKFGVWIGNMSFDTSKEDIVRYLVNKTADSEDGGKILESDIIRVNMPLAKNDGKTVRNKGFAYLDFQTKEQMEAAIALSETQLNGRNLLIKNSKNFEGRPDKNDLVSMSKNPKSRILFVGNLSFDTTDELLKRHFQHCGEIVRIRMATFEDSGKCKGFAFIDFKDEAGATAALTDRSCRKIASRPIRMEYGEDRSSRHVRRRPAVETPHNSTRKEPSNITQIPEQTPSTFKKAFKEHKRQYSDYKDSNNRIKSSVALAGAQRASAGIVPSEGKKVKFD